ncbi:hypothetical protein GGX14DRAFT_656688 [Mycena pura]|uniref:Uncharacterized protein n=1 Tax=Mycena pura TaxID=153505 RepID=A0AAD6V701_9AGAR|nr:hypothetical protein GGX14DRAFT_656688 [Mycena pura]
MAYSGKLQNVALERHDRINAVDNQDENPNRRVTGDPKAREEVTAWLDAPQSRHNPLTLKPAQKPHIFEEIARLQQGEEDLVEAAGDDVVKTAVPSEEEMKKRNPRLFEEITRFQRLEEDLVEFAAARGHADEMRQFFKDLLFVKTALPSEEELQKELNAEGSTASARGAAGKVPASSGLEQTELAGLALRLTALPGLFSVLALSARVFAVSALVFATFVLLQLLQRPMSVPLNLTLWHRQGRGDQPRWSKHYPLNAIDNGEHIQES